MRFRNILNDFKRLKKNLHLDRIATNTNMVSVNNFNILIDTLLELYKYPTLKNILFQLKKNIILRKLLVTN